MLKPDEARLLLESTTRTQPVRLPRPSLLPAHRSGHDREPGSALLYRRMKDVAELGQTPESLRAQTFLQRHLRPTTDWALAAANINWSNEAMANKTRDQRKRLDALRVAFSHQREATPPRSFASVPLRRAIRDGRG